MVNDQQVILHWYPQSPFAQKIFFVLKYKKIDFKTVEISVMEPRPLRRPLDSNYERTPILQIGNQVFCDTKLIIDELEKRYPEPSLYPLTRNGQSSKTLAYGVTHLLNTSVFSAIPTQFDWSKFPQAFIDSRSKFKGVPIDIAKQKQMQPFLKLELQAQLDQLVEGLVNDQWILDTAQPSDSDFSLAMITFFLYAVLGQDWTKEHYPLLAAHYKRVNALISSQPTPLDLTAEEALEIAKQQQSIPPQGSSSSSSLFTIGEQVSVTPLDTARTPAVGELVSLTSQRVIIRTHDDRTGYVYIHFPMAYYVVTPISSRL
ncbi:uncharacterized protein BX664DRAFT_376966 [Halteromyces radiatus]|uniref:uncharacterized protein n=1 Tax=Halteromyces radiatus TaxID=101107 RepID=UPI00221E9CA2|nr:uncharacterized protein BX664DRAFT_376966 [Halteromyces radiatus]KAI8098573.1 hypothetical protein BX664DRAFT_376966 [Halteromyces radiatus]